MSKVTSYQDAIDLAKDSGMNMEGSVWVKGQDVVVLLATGETIGGVDYKPFRVPENASTFSLNRYQDRWDPTGWTYVGQWEAGA